MELMSFVSAAWDICVDSFDILACIQDILAGDCSTCTCEVLAWLGLMTC
jgi:hypothetical protein